MNTSISTSNNLHLGSTKIPNQCEKNPVEQKDRSDRHRVSSATDARIEAQLCFPGGGKFCFWQLGAVRYIQRHYDLSKVAVSGASAGSLAAAVAVLECDINVVVESMIRKLAVANVFDRMMGLMGIMGDAVEEVLEEHLPQDAHELLTLNNVSVLVKPLRLNRTHHRIRSFPTRESVKEALCASGHVPFISNGKVAKICQGKWYIDGAIFSKEEDIVDHAIDAPVIWLRHAEDPQINRDFPDALDFIRAPKDEDELWNIFEMGYIRAADLDNQGYFASMPRKKKTWMKDEKFQGESPVVCVSPIQ